MNFRTSKSILILRNVVRKLGLTTLIKKISGGANYEESFSRAMLENVSNGDVVWDIGANVGFYTKQFADKVGSEGKVYGFEPSPKTISILNQNIAGLQNVTTVNKALSDYDGELNFLIQENSDTTTDRLVDNNYAPKSGEKCVKVSVVTADSLIKNSEVSFPNFCKIDVEGYEMEVVKGMSGMLNDQRLRVICIEVHFTRLNERGLDGAPKQIESMLKDSHFATKWVDFSHIVGIRS